jgi:hypothetical protein
MKHTYKHQVAITLLLVLLAACGSPTASPSPSASASASPEPSVEGSPTAAPSGAPTGEINSLVEARAAWVRSGAANYDFVISRQCFCMLEYVGPFTVRVRDGVSAVTRTSDGSEVDPLILELLPLSAEELFAFVEERQAQASFRVTYDQAIGLPLSVWSDPIPEAADDELGIEVRDFTATP